MIDCNGAPNQHLTAMLAVGDHEAFHEIYRRYARLLFSFARKNISSKVDCEEIIQDVFTSLWARREELKIVSLRHYLFSSVRYKIIRYFQHSSVRRKYAAHYALFAEICECAAEENRSIETILETLEEKLAPLPERCRTAFKLRLHENLSNADIAERMHISKKTVEVYMFKAFQHFRNSYSEIYQLGGSSREPSRS